MTCNDFNLKHSLVAALAVGLAAFAPANAQEGSNGNGVPGKVGVAKAAALELGGGGAVTGNVLVYTNFLDDGQEAQAVIGILTAAGKTVTGTATTDPTTLAGLLAGKNSFVVPELHDSSFASPAELTLVANTFAAFAPTLQAFVQAGGNVIVMEGDLEGAWGEAVINAIGIANVTWVDETLGQNPLAIARPGDCLVTGIGSIQGVNGDGSFVDNSGNLTPVIIDPTGDLVVAYRTFGSGTFVIIGFDYFSFNVGQHDVLLVNACQCRTATACPKTLGYWKHHPDAWACDLPLELGGQSYTQDELLAILQSPVKGDHRFILAKQLIAAKLNICSGTDPTPIAATITEADNVLAGQPKLTTPMRFQSPAMTALGSTLDNYNQAESTPSCVAGCR